MIDLEIHKTQQKDIDIILSIEADKENALFITQNTYKEHLDLISNTDIEHLILKTKDDKLIGFVILAGISDKNKSIEFRRIVIKEKGKGFGRLAIKKIKRYCFTKLKCHRLWLDVLENNKRARHLYQSEGFIEEGKLRDCLFIENKFQSLIIMSILKDEYKNEVILSTLKK